MNGFIRLVFLVDCIVIKVGILKVRLWRSYVKYMVLRSYVVCYIILREICNVKDLIGYCMIGWEFLM